MLVADANIWIDLDAAGLVDAKSFVPLGLETTDFVIHELKHNALGSRLESLGVVAHSMSPEQIAQVYSFRQRSARSSVPDYSTLVVAIDSGAVLVTGDSHLRGVAEAAGLEVHGVLWAIERLMTLGALEPTVAIDAIEDMIAAGARLPAKEVAETISRCKG